MERPFDARSGEEPPVTGSKVGVKPIKKMEGLIAWRTDGALEESDVIESPFKVEKSYGYCPKSGYERNRKLSCVLSISLGRGRGTPGSDAGPATSTKMTR